MNINRLLSRRDKDGGPHRRDKSRDKSSDRKLKLSRSVSSISAAFSKPNGKGSPLLQTSYSTIHTTSANSRPGFVLQTRPHSSEHSRDGIIGLFKPDPQKSHDKEQEIKIQKIKQRLQKEKGYTGIQDEQISYALSTQYADGDADKAFDMLVLFQRSVEGEIEKYNPAVNMLGSENRGGVTCYIDALLFSMFARLESFEPILYPILDDEPRRRLSTLIRLWVNMLRTGKLIQTDITAHLQDALAACGWEHPQNEQQDTSEAFGFITEQLQLPLLTLKMDLFHNGAEDATDDHKFIHERLLDVAVPDETESGRQVQLEDCLENYFNNRVEVLRKLERSNTVSSVRSGQSQYTEKEGAVHIEVAEVSWSTPNTPTSAVPPGSPLTPSSGRHRATSIIRHRVIQEDGKEDVSTESDAASSPASVRKGSIRKEVLMPAWQFFNLIPWYTKTAPANDAEVAAHFSNTKPVLGICLKRYGVKDGKSYRKNTAIDIPLDIRLPHFIEDDAIPEDGPLVGNFKLSLQSVICHRGKSLQAGHYISFIRGASQIADGDSASNRRLSNASQPPHYMEDRWIKFDDLAETRITTVDINEALKTEMPYLLFYQVQPTFTVSPPSGPDILPPSYTDSGLHSQSSPQLDGKKEHLHPAGYFDGARDEPAPAIRFSAEIERPRRSIQLADGEERRGSLAFTETSLGSTASSLKGYEVISAPVTPNEETTAQRMSRAASRFAKSGSRSRPTSAAGENRISATFTRGLTILTSRSKEQLSKVEPSKENLVPSDGKHGKDSSGSTDATHDSGVAGLEETTRKLDEGAIGRSKSKRGRKRDKSKGPVEKIDNDDKQNHRHLHKGKGKAKEVPDRECKIM